MQSRAFVSARAIDCVTRSEAVLAGLLEFPYDVRTMGEAAHGACAQARMLANRATQVIDEQGIVGHDHEHAAPLLDEFAHCFFVRALLLQKNGSGRGHAASSGACGQLGQTGCPKNSGCNMNFFRACIKPTHAARHPAIKTALCAQHALETIQ